MITSQPDLFFRFGAALAMGILIGLQREHAHLDERVFAGIRTFALMALAGCSAAFLADVTGAFSIFLITLAAVGILVAVSYFVTARQGEIGMTTEIAALATVLIGGIAYWDQLPLAAALTVAVTVLLSVKPELRGLVREISEDDLLALLKFAVISAIILPVLPNRTFGPLDVFNPYKTWLMVVLISGIGFLGYILIKIRGSQQGIGLTGLLGGLISSTAVTLSFTQRSQAHPSVSRAFAPGIVIAWSMMYLAILVQVAVVNRSLLQAIWLPILLAGTITLASGAFLFRYTGSNETGDISFSNPVALRQAITFGLLYAVVLLVGKAAQTAFGETGVYVSSTLAGLTGADAVTLSMAELNRSGTLDAAVAGRAILLAAASNTALKGGLVLSAGSTQLRRAILIAFLLALAGALGGLFLL